MLKCLLVDDDLDDQEIFLMALSELEKQVDCIVMQDCTKAIDWLKSDTDYLPDYIFLDMNMYKKNGLECLREIRQCLHLKKVSVIMYSTTSDNNIIQQALQLGASEFLVKPASVTTLTERLSSIMKIRSYDNKG